MSFGERDNAALTAEKIRIKLDMTWDESIRATGNAGNGSATARTATTTTGLSMMTRRRTDMSRSWRTTRLIAAADLFGGRLEKHGVRETIVEAEDVHEWTAKIGATLPKGAGGTIPGTTERSRCLTDGTNIMWVDVSKSGYVSEITRYGDNDCNGILGAIDDEFEAGLIDEDHSDYWGAFEGEVAVIPWEDFDDDRDDHGEDDDDDEP